MDVKKRIRILFIVVMVMILLIGFSPNIVKYYQFYKISKVVDEIYEVQQSNGEMSSEIIVYNAHGKFTTLVQAYDEKNYYLQGKVENDEDNSTITTNFVCYDDVNYYATDENLKPTNNTCNTDGIDDAFAIFKFLDYDKLSSSKFDYRSEDGVGIFVLKDEFLSEVTKEWRSEISYVALFLNEDGTITLYMESIDTDSIVVKMFITYDLDRYIELPTQIKTSEN